LRGTINHDTSATLTCLHSAW